MVPEAPGELASMNWSSFHKPTIYCNRRYCNGHCDNANIHRLKEELQKMRFI